MMKIHIIPLLILFFVCSLVSCNNKGSGADLGHTTSTYQGLYYATDDSTNISLKKTDSVEFVLVDNQSYSIYFFPHQSTSATFCDHTGTVSGFDTNNILFFPDAVDYVNCDSVRIPRGQFSADYVTVPDTIIIQQINGLAVRRLKLLK